MPGAFLNARNIPSEAESDTALERKLIVEIKLTVPAEIIAALKLFAAVKDVRYYINGINLEIGATESRLVATNGHSLACARIESPQKIAREPLTDIIIPGDLLKHIKGKGEVVITVGPPETSTNTKGEVVPVSSARPVTLAYAGTTMSGKTLDGKFPTWRRVIPSKVTGEPAQFNPNYVGDLGKAYAALHGTKKDPKVAIAHNGSDAALIDLGNEDFIAVLMPLRPGTVSVPKAPPTWWADLLRVPTNSASDPV